MTHFLGRVVPDGRTVTHTAGLDLVLTPGVPRFVLLHFDEVNLAGAARLEVALGYGTDVFTAGSGTSFWSRPVDAGAPPSADQTCAIIASVCLIALHPSPP